MGPVLGAVLPVFALIALGTAARASRMLDAPGLRGMTDLVFFLAIPALLFGSLMDSHAAGMADLAALFMGAVLAVFAVGLALGLLLLRVPLSQATVLGLNGCYGNTALLGLPLVDAAFGPPGVAVLLPVIAVHSLVLLPLASVLIGMEGVRRGNLLALLGRTVSGVVRNPTVVALLLALLLRSVGVAVPGPAHRVVALLGAMASPLALFTLGGSLPDFASQGSVREAGISAVLKLLVLPALVWLLGTAWAVPPFPLAVAVTAGGVPTGATAFFLARRAGTLTAATAGTVVLTTVLSVLTLSLILGALRP